MRRNNSWNRFFHSDEVDAIVRKKKEAEKIVSLSHGYLQMIGGVTYKDKDKDSASVTGAISLMEVMSIHKNAWVNGFRSKEMGPNPYEKYRCQSIETMTTSEVYLGDVFGLVTGNIDFWEERRYRGKSGGNYPVYEYLTDYQIVLWQYKSHLSSCIKAIAESAASQLAKFKELGY